MGAWRCSPVTARSNCLADVGQTGPWPGALVMVDRHLRPWRSCSGAGQARAPMDSAVLLRLGRLGRSGGSGGPTGKELLDYDGDKSGWKRWRCLGGYVPGRPDDGSPSGLGRHLRALVGRSRGQADGRMAVFSCHCPVELSGRCWSGGALARGTGYGGPAPPGLGGTVWRADVWAHGCALPFCSVWGGLAGVGVQAAAGREGASRL